MNCKKSIQIDINIYEIKTVFLVFQIFVHKQPQHKAIAYTNNISLKFEINKSTLKSLANILAKYRRCQP